jgi:hypothetical protein
MFRYFRTLMTALALSAVASAGPGGDGLVGTWVSEDGSITLKIESPTRLLYDGHPYRCSIDARAIYVADENGIVTPYLYRTDGKRLELLYPEGGAVLFDRAPPATRKRAAPDAPEARNRRRDENGGRSTGQNALVEGRYCSYSGSPGGGYSTTYWAWFDGIGNFRYGSGSYYSGGGDLYGREGEDGRGTYEVRGDTIVLRYLDGSSDRAYVHNRGAGGRITEIRYGDSLYAAQLCR